MQLTESATSTPSPWNKKDKVNVDVALNSPRFIRIYTENSDTGIRILICTDLPRFRLFQEVPAIQRYVDPDTGDIVLPGADCGVEDDILHYVVSTTLFQTGADKPTLEVEEHPVAYIQMHVVLVLLGLDKDAAVLLNRFWELFSRHELSLAMVSWIWEVFGTQGGQEAPAWVYCPPYADFYVQVMAWQIINLGFLGKLDNDIRNYVWGDGHFSQPGLKKVIEERHGVYGLEEGFEISTVAAKLDRKFKQHPAPEPSTAVEQKAAQPRITPALPPFNFQRAQAGLEPNSSRWNDNMARHSSSAIQEKLQDTEGQENERPETPEERTRTIWRLGNLVPTNSDIDAIQVEDIPEQGTEQASTSAGSGTKTATASVGFSWSPFGQKPIQTNKDNVAAPHLGSSSPVNPFGQALKHRPSSESLSSSAAPRGQPQAQWNQTPSSFGTASQSPNVGNPTWGFQGAQTATTGTGSSMATSQSPVPIFQGMRNTSSTAWPSNTPPPGNPAFGQPQGVGLGFGTPSTTPIGQGFGSVPKANPFGAPAPPPKPTLNPGTTTAGSSFNFSFNGGFGPACPAGSTSGSNPFAFEGGGSTGSPSRVPPVGMRRVASMRGRSKKR